MMSEEEHESQRVLFLPQNPHDVQTAREVFAAGDMELCACEDLSQIIAAAERGAGLLLIASERLENRDFDRLVSYLQSQPAWSDLPVLVVTRSGTTSAAARRLTEVANTTLVERPVHLKPLLSTAHAALRDRLRQYDIRRSIANRDSFLAMLGHELRNPLAAIVLALEQLGIDRSSDRALDIIRRQSGNLERIVDDLLEVSRISRGVISFNKSRVDVVEIVRETTDAFENIAGEQGLTLTVTLPDTPLPIDADSVRIEQALGNLLSNAVRYTPKGGSITVEVEQKDDNVVISVGDSGIGIPAEMTDGIFELFAQAHGDFSRREGGLGLGLSLANGIIKKHNGEIIAESDGKDMGSRFSIVLPANAPQIPATEASSMEQKRRTEKDAATAEQRSALRILVVEDVDDLRVPFCEMLRLRGHTVDEAATGEAGLEAVEKGQHDVILLDIGLPDIDGYEVARRIRSQLESVPLIALTGYGRSQDREQAELAGFDSLLTKPVSFDELEDALRSV